MTWRILTRREASVSSLAFFVGWMGLGVATAWPDRAGAWDGGVDRNGLDGRWVTAGTV
jgi:hypothetical protein